MVMLTRLETPSELFAVTVFGLAEILLFRDLFDLLEKLLEFSGDHNHFFLIKIRAVLLYDL